MELFNGIPDADLDILEARLGMIRWPQGAEEPAPLERLDHIYLVREGRLALYERISPEHEVMVAILEPGAIWSTLGNVLRGWPRSRPRRSHRSPHARWKHSPPGTPGWAATSPRCSRSG